MLCTKKTEKKSLDFRDVSQDESNRIMMIITRCLALTLGRYLLSTFCVFIHLT